MLTKSATTISTDEVDNDVDDGGTGDVGGVGCTICYAKELSCVARMLHHLDSFIICGEVKVVRTLTCKLDGQSLQDNQYL